MSWPLSFRSAGRADRVVRRSSATGTTSREPNEADVDRCCGADSCQRGARVARLRLSVQRGASAARIAARCIRRPGVPPFAEDDFFRPMRPFRLSLFLFGSCLSPPSLSARAAPPLHPSAHKTRAGDPGPLAGGGTAFATRRSRRRFSLLTCGIIPEGFPRGTFEKTSILVRI
jgi:hypothetical protein